MQSGAWQCVGTQNGAPISVTVTNGSVAIPATADGANITCTVTNATAQLTLLKNVIGGANPNLWTLTATPTGGLPATSVTGASMTSAANTFFVKPTTTTAPLSTTSYALTETGPTSHRQYGDWVCVNVATGAPVTINPAALEIPVGTHFSCTITNAPATGTAVWEKVDEAGNALAGSVWSLTGPMGPSSQVVPIMDCVAANSAACTGPDKDPAAGGFLLSALQWGTYTLTETQAPPGYVVGSPAPTFTFEIGPANTATVKLAWNLGEIENAQAEGVALPLTGGDSTMTYGIAGVAFVVFALAGAYILRRRREVAT